MLTGVVSTLGACQTFFVMVVSLVREPIPYRDTGVVDMVTVPRHDEFSVP